MSGKFVYAKDKNLLRQHLTPKERRGQIEAAIKANPEQSNRQVAGKIVAPQ
jgi:hypothetical protein